MTKWKHHLESQRFQYWAVAFALLTSFLAIIGQFVILIKFPIYVDEILYKASLGRLYVDGLATNLMPQCGSAWRYVPPFLVQPARLIEYWTLDSLNPISATRYWGIFLYWSSLLSIGGGLAQWVANHKKLQVFVFLIPFCLGHIGLMAVVGIMGRPEALHVFYFGAWLFLFSSIKGPSSFVKNANLKNWLVKPLFVMSAVLVSTAYHRGLFFAPVILGISTFILLNGHWRWIGAGFSIAITYSVYVYAVQWSACPDSPQSFAYNASLTLTPDLLVHHPAKFFNRFTESIKKIWDFWPQILFPGGYGLQWMPNGFKAPPLFFWIGRIYFAIIVLGNFYLLNKIRKIDQIFFIVAILTLGSLLVFVGLDMVRAWYRVPTLTFAFTVPFLLMLVRLRYHSLIFVLGVTGALLALLSTPMLHLAVKPHLQSWESAYLPYSVGSMGIVKFEEFRAKNEANAIECFSQNKSETPFVVDMQTFTLLADQKGFLPVFQWFLHGPAELTYSQTISEMYKLGISRGFGNCSGEIEKFMNIESKHGDLCCFIGKKPDPWKFSHQEVGRQDPRCLHR